MLPCKGQRWFVFHGQAHPRYQPPSDFFQCFKAIPYVFSIPLNGLQIVVTGEVNKHDRHFRDVDILNDRIVRQVAWPRLGSGTINRVLTSRLADVTSTSVSNSIMTFENPETELLEIFLDTGNWLNLLFDVLGDQVLNVFRETPRYGVAKYLRNTTSEVFPSEVKYVKIPPSVIMTTAT